MSSEPTHNWPKPYLLELYQQAVEQGCIRIVLRGQTEAERDSEYKSLKAAFYRMRRMKDGNYMVTMRPEYQMVTMRYERHIGRALLIYSSLPDNQMLPAIEAVDGKTPLPQPAGAVPGSTTEVEPEDFDATEHVKSLLGKIEIEGEDEGGTSDGL